MKLAKKRLQKNDLCFLGKSDTSRQSTSFLFLGVKIFIRLCQKSLCGKLFSVKLIVWFSSLGTQNEDRKVFLLSCHEKCSYLFIPSQFILKEIYKHFQPPPEKSLLISSSLSHSKTTRVKN